MRGGVIIRAAPACAFALLLAGVAARPAAADDVADFYRGKQVKLAIGFDSGSSYDLYARTVVRHMEKYLPGQSACHRAEHAGSRQPQGRRLYRRRRAA